MGICFCLCSHLSLSSPLLLGHPPLRGASPLWPGWREESAGPAFLSASSFHQACLFSKQVFLFIYPRDSLWRSSLSLPRFFFFPLFYSSLFSSSVRASLSHPVLSWLHDFSTCPPYSRDSERKGTGTVGYSCSKHIQTCTKPIHYTTNCMTLRGKATDSIKIKDL